MQNAEAPLSEKARELQNATRRFVENEVDPRAREIEATDSIPAELLERAKEIGLFAISIPGEYGGLGLKMTEKVAVY
jgi:acyl-CoA dehydrogenase